MKDLSPKNNQKKYRAFILLLIAGVLIFSAALSIRFLWKDQLSDNLIFKLVKIVKTVRNYRNLPDPVTIHANEFHLPLRGKLFVIPQKYVKDYFRNSTNGKLAGFTLQLLLPDLDGYSIELDKEFRGGRRNILEAVVRLDGRTQEEIYNYWYERSFSSTKKSYGSKRISDDPVVEFVGRYWEKREGSTYVGQEFFYLLKDQQVHRTMRCTVRDNTGSHSRQSIPRCSMNLSYDDYIVIENYFDRTFHDKWIEISDGVLSLLSSFERF